MRRCPVAADDSERNSAVIHIACNTFVFNPAMTSLPSPSCCAVTATTGTYAGCGRATGEYYESGPAGLIVDCAAPPESAFRQAVNALAGLLASIAV